METQTLKAAESKILAAFFCKWVTFLNLMDNYEINIMKPCYKNLVLFFTFVLMSSCTKEDDMIQQNPINFIDPSEYLPLKSGNYWILQMFTNFGAQPDSLRALEFIDSIYVGNDTIINELKHNNIYKSSYENIDGQKSNLRTYLLTSLRTKHSKMIHWNGSTYFSTDTIIKAHYANEIINNKTVYSVTGKAKYITNMSLPIGKKDALKWEVVHFTDKSISTTGNDEYKEDESIYFIKGIGFGKIIINGDLYPSNNTRFEKQLVRYTIH